MAKTLSLDSRITFIEAVIFIVTVFESFQAAAHDLENSLKPRNLDAFLNSAKDLKLHRGKRALGGEPINNVNILSSNSESSCTSFAVALMLNGEVVCTGVVLSNMTIGTATSCFQNSDIATDSVFLASYRVAVGVVEIGPDAWENAYQLKDRIQILPLSGVSSSLALVYLKSPLPIEIQSIPLITPSISYSSYSQNPSEARLILGWDRTNPTQTSLHLSKAEITNPIVSTALCAEIELVENDQNSAIKYLNQKKYGCIWSGACPRDIGGPILYISDPKNGDSCANIHLDGILVYLKNPSCDGYGISVYVSILPHRSWIEARIEFGYSTVVE